MTLSYLYYQPIVVPAYQQLPPLKKDVFPYSHLWDGNKPDDLTCTQTEVSPNQMSAIITRLWNLRYYSRQ